MQPASFGPLADQFLSARREALQFSADKHRSFCELAHDLGVSAPGQIALAVQEHMSGIEQHAAAAIELDAPTGLPIATCIKPDARLGLGQPLPERRWSSAWAPPAAASTASRAKACRSPALRPALAPLAGPGRRSAARQWPGGLQPRQQLSRQFSLGARPESHRGRHAAIAHGNTVMRQRGGR